LHRLLSGRTCPIARAGVVSDIATHAGMACSVIVIRKAIGALIQAMTA
jgi:hypothetical protein